MMVVISNCFILLIYSLFQIRNLIRYHPNVNLSSDDVLNTRKKTIGIWKGKILIDESPYILINTGGQRNERKKWLNLFEDNYNCVFVVGLTQYHQILYEDDITNRLEEDLSVFEKTVNSEKFKNKKIILVLSKKDVFDERLKLFPYEKYHQKKNENNTPLEDIIEKFNDKIDNKDRLIIKVMSGLNETHIIELLELIKKTF